MNVLINKLYGQNNNQTGVILSGVIGKAVTLQQKSLIESQLKDYARNTLYPNEPLQIFSDENSDTPSIVVLKDTSNLPSQTIVIK